MIIGDSTYTAQGRRTLVMKYTLDGTRSEVNMLQGNGSNYSNKVVADNCSDLLIGGLFAGNGYDSYLWSTGERESSIFLTGSILGAGQHNIGVSVYKDGCERRDSIIITVKNNIGIADLVNQSGLFQIYPNPVTDVAVVEYEMLVDAQMHLKIFDFTGREIARIVDQKQQAGKHKIQHDMREHKPGVYHYQMKIGEKSETKKVIFLK